MFAGEQTARASVAQAAHAALQSAGVTGAAQVVAAYVSAPGLAPASAAAGLALAGIQGNTPTCEGDERSALYSSFAAGAGVVVLAGTGSFAIGRAPDGRVETAGGYGPVFGDEGSGYSIGVAGLRLLGRVLDGIAPWGPLARRLAADLGVSTPAELRHRVYGNGFGRREIAALAVPISSLAGGERPDGEACRIMDAAAAALAELAAALGGKLGLSGSRFPVAMVGGLRQAGTPLMGPFERHLRQLEPRAQLVEPLLPPLGGAILVALERAGVPLSESVLARLQQSLAQASGV